MEQYDLPDGWVWTTIGEVARINPRDGEIRGLQDELKITFVPMAAVDAATGTISQPEEQPLSRVRKGFTPFTDGDVLFAKITPSMENGKAAIARQLTNGRGFGSTEFHVFRPLDCLLPEFLFYFIRQRRFRMDAKANFSGTAGQLRVPTGFLEDYVFPLPPLPEQRRIVARLDALFAESRAACKALEGVSPLVKRFKQAVLAAAFSGKLTGREPDDEPATLLLERIRQERRGRWEEKLRAQGKIPTLFKYEEPEPPDTSDLPELPEGWVWTTFDYLLSELKNGFFSGTPSLTPPGVPILRISAARPLSVNLTDVRFVPENRAVDAAGYKLRDGDLLFTRYNGSLDLVGICAMVRGLGEKYVLYPDKLIRARVFTNCVLAEYLELYFASAMPRRFIEDKAKSSAGQQGIAGGDIRSIPVAVPPFTEQARIVQKVQSLFAQADLIKQVSEASQSRLDRLDQQILDRAFRGELVPQDPDDEPATALLARIQAERATTAKDGRGGGKASRQMALPLAGDTQ